MNSDLFGKKTLSSLTLVYSVYLIFCRKHPEPSVSHKLCPKSRLHTQSQQALRLLYVHTKKNDKIYSKPSHMTKHICCVPNAHCLIIQCRMNRHYILLTTVWCIAVFVICIKTGLPSLSHNSVEPEHRHETHHLDSV